MYQIWRINLDRLTHQNMHICVDVFFCLIVLCTADASGCLPGQYCARRPGGRESLGPGIEGRQNTWSSLGCPWDGALQVNAHTHLSQTNSDEVCRSRKKETYTWTKRQNFEQATRVTCRWKQWQTYDKLKTPHTLLRDSFRTLHVLEFRRWRALFNPIKLNTGGAAESVT